MKSNLKTKLLLGAAVTALSFGVSQGAFAANEFLVDGDDSGSFTTTGPDETADTALDWDAGTNGAGTAVASHDLGVVASGTINFSADATVGDSSSTVAGITATVTGQTLTIANNDGGGNARTATVANGIGLADGIAALNLAINGSTTDGDALTVDINGDVNLGTGTLTITSQDNASTATVNVFGNLTSGDITLDENATTVTLLLDGTSAQTVSGNIVAGTDNEGDVTVSNAAGVTFSGTIGATGTEIDNILIASADGTNSAATFTKQVDVNTAITMGNGTGTDTNTLTLDSTGASFAVNGALTGTAGDTDNIVVTGGNTVTLGTATAANNNIDLITVSGNSTLTSGQNIQAAAITVDSGSTLATTGNTVTAPVANSGTLQLAGGDVTGNVTGTGSLDVDADTAITGNVAGTSANIATGADLTIAGANEYSVTNTTLVGGAEFETSAADQTLSGNFLADADGDGTITITNANNTTTITGNIGTSTKKIGTFAAGGALANTITTTGNLYATTITGHDASSVQFLGTTQAVTGAWTGGDIIVGNAAAADPTVTFNGALTSIDDVLVNAESTAYFKADATFDAAGGGLTNNGTTRVGVDATLNTGNTNLDGTGTYTLDVADADGTLTADDFGRITDANNGSTIGAGKLTVNVTGNINTTNATVASVLTGVLAVDGEVLADNSFQYTFTADRNVNDTDIIVTARTIEDMANNSQLTAGVGATLDGLSTSTDTEIAAVIDNIAAASSQEDVDDILESVTPSVDAGAVTGATSFTTSTRNVTNTQLASLRDGTEASGMYAGNVTNGLRGWVQGFGQTGDQDVRDGVAGYDVDSYGIAVGLDTESLAENWIWGVAFAYADTEVDSDGANNTKTDIDSYQVSLYGNYDLDDRTYIAGQVGYVWGDNDQTRSNVGGVNGLTATSDYDSNVYFASLEAGRKYMVGGNTVLTPKALVNYQHYDADGYTETGAGGANLTTSGDDLDLFEIGVGVDASWDYQQADGSYLQPKIGVGVRHDLVGDEYQTSSTFQAGGSSFKTEGFDPAQTTFNVSAGLTYFSTTNWELSAGYDFEYKSDYDSHAGKLKAAYKF